MNRQFILPGLSAGTPEGVQVALARAAEEAAELTKEAMKALRFGLGNRYPADGPTNAEKIVAEFNDIRAALVDAGLLRGFEALADPLPVAPGTRLSDQVVEDMAGKFARCGDSIARELCATVSAGRPSHPQLVKDVKSAAFVALHSATFRALVTDIEAGA